MIPVSSIYRFIQQSAVVPEFVVNSTAGVMLTTLFLITPFSINNLINGRFLLGGLSLIIAAMSIVSAYTCYQGKYHWGINLFLMTPLIMITIAFITIRQGTVGTFWAYLAVLAFYFILTERIAWVVNVLFVAVMIPPSWGILDPHVFARFIIMLGVTSAFAAIFIRIINEQHDRLQEQAITDPLTGLYNRAVLQASVEHAIHQYKRAGVQTSLIMLDIDDFKSINDDLGHAVGDEAIKSLSQFLKESFRGADRIFRMGGEEFLVLVHDADESTAYDKADKLRMDVENSALVPDRKITVSIGVAGIRKDHDWTQWITDCDTRLYEAKNRGRNQVIV